ncbi:hypothetical protein DM01DRAFT_1301794 [Hesseltinella vesiculosa]|uniref:Carotenoid oxygenase n=1 Tax=Hesseltinella vesiculosa TaxID=101127 RepID=A0A1X2GQG5_9FUNG|nr:hypothetical protein DM01DRAFT_1301794 [Hesseltinella vesiculosa]
MPNLHTSNVLAKFQKNAFRNVPQSAKPIELKTKGTIPPWLNGVMYRVGGGKFQLGEGGTAFTIQHAFDGLPIMHRFEIHGEANKVMYRSRYLADDAEKRIVASNGRGEIFFGHTIEMSTWGRIKDAVARIRGMSNGASADASPSSQPIGVTVTPNYPVPTSWKTKETSPEESLMLVSKTDANMLQKVNRDTLEPEKLFTYQSYHNELTGPFAPAHQIYDYETKENLSLTISVGRNADIKVFSMARDGATKILATISHAMDTTQSPVRTFYCHSFFATKNYVVVPESPLFLRNYGLDFLLNGNIASGLEWDAKTPTRLHVVDRHGGGHLATFQAPAYFAFHIANGVDWVDDKGRIHLELDCSTYNGDMLYEVNSFGNLVRASDYDAFLTKQSQKQTLHNGIRNPPKHFSSFGDLQRFHVTWHPSTIAKDTSVPVCPSTIANNIEFMRINTSLVMKNYTYTYACRLQPPTESSGERYDLVKVNVHTGDVLTYQQKDLRHGYMSSEPVFVARPDGTSEDDGVVLSLVSVFDDSGEKQDHCFLLILDASSFTELATVSVGDFVAPTFHGSFHVEHSFELGSFN